MEGRSGRRPSVSFFVSNIFKEFGMKKLLLIVVPILAVSAVAYGNVFDDLRARTDLTGPEINKVITGLNNLIADGYSRSMDFEAPFFDTDGARKIKIRGKDGRGYTLTVTLPIFFVGQETKYPERVYAEYVKALKQLEKRNPIYISALTIVYSVAYDWASFNGMDLTSQEQQVAAVCEGYKDIGVGYLGKVPGVKNITVKVAPNHTWFEFDYEGEHYYSDLTWLDGERHEGNRIVQDKDQGAYVMRCDWRNFTTDRQLFDEPLSYHGEQLHKQGKTADSTD